ncbi:MAG: GNAT family N-acetyltransferase [Bacilli bacterium]
MEYKLRKANINDIDYIKSAKLYSIFQFSKDISQEEKDKIYNYVDKHISSEIEYYKIIENNRNIIGCVLLMNKDDGKILDEIYIDKQYRNKGIGTNIIDNIIKENDKIYLWVYKENIAAITLYKKLGFSIRDTTETRYYMEYKNNNRL